MNWNLGQYFILPVKQAFEKVVVSYISILWSQIKAEFENPQTPEIRRITESQSQPEATPSGISESLENFSRELITKEITIELLRLVKSYAFLTFFIYLFRFPKSFTL